MTTFAGFPAGRTRFTPIPDLFFSELLPAINDLAELKVTLYMFWFLNRQRGYPRYMTLPELEGETVLLTALSTTSGYLDGIDPRTILRDAVESAVQRGTLLRLSIADDEGREVDYLFLNTPQGRKAVEDVRAGALILETTGFVREARVQEPRHSIFQLYEQNIGLLQPLLAEELRQAERDYPPDWIADAFRIAAEQNVRSWKAIWERWVREGRDEAPWFRRRSQRR